MKNSRLSVSRALFYSGIPVLFAFTGVAYASDARSGTPSQGDKMRQCLNDGYVYMTAANFRDAGRSPEDALNTLKGGNPESRLPFIKAVINEVYFDSMFANQHGELFRTVMVNECMNGPKHWKPLK